MMRLYICEKPSQAREISRFVGASQRGNGCSTGKGVTVTWCIGHLLEQAAPEFYNPDLKSWNIDLLPVVPESWKMEVKSSTREQYQVVAKLLKQATEVIIATDADREGEVIAREVMQLGGYRGPVRRLWLSAFDDASVKKALANLKPGEKTWPMYLSGVGRARADWLAGMNLTMALTKAFGGGGKDGVLHCGRVQTPVLALVVRRERAIAQFVPKTYYLLQTVFELQGAMVPMGWQTPKERLDAQGHCVDLKYVQSVASKVSGKVGRLTAVETTRERELAPLPYSLGSLQREASARFGIKAQAVLDAAQSLYEKHKATSYPRSDCEHLPVSMHSDAPGVLAAMAKIDPALAKLVSKVDLTIRGRAFNDKNVTAHHAIIPTGNPNVRMADMSAIEARIYDLIRRRYLAQFFGAYEYNKTVITLLCEAEAFGATGKMPLVQGWKLAYEGMAVAEKKPAKPSKNQDASEEQAQPDIQLPALRVNDQGINRRAEVQTTKTKPPKRYTEGTLLGAMESIDKEIDDPRLKKIMQNKEKAGIGTDATRSSIIEGLFKRGYMENEGKFLKPTVKGNHLIEVIEGAIPAMADPVLTALWEDQLGQIETGQLELITFEGWLGKWLAQQIDKIRSKAPSPLPSNGRGPGGMASQSRPSEASQSVHPCPECGKPLKRRTGGSGVFWGCSDYPKCRCTLTDQEGRPAARPANTQTPRVLDSAAQQNAGTTCKACARPMLLKNSARGSFYGCSGFPDCRSTESVAQPAAIPAARPALGLAGRGFGKPGAPL